MAAVPTIRRHCAEKFEELSRALGRVDTMADDLAALRRAVVGNGEPERSLLVRVQLLEESRRTIRGTRAKWGERLWKSLIAVALVLMGWWLRG